jgi:uncharacterized protein YgbK (DUF1537 family)
MMIQTWQERCEDFDDMHITTTKDLDRVRQEEIDELRAEVKRLQEEYRHILLYAAELVLTNRTVDGFINHKDNKRISKTLKAKAEEIGK